MQEDVNHFQEMMQAHEQWSKEHTEVVQRLDNTSGPKQTVKANLEEVKALQGTIPQGHEQLNVMLKILERFPQKSRESEDQKIAGLR